MTQPALPPTPPTGPTSPTDPSAPDGPDWLPEALAADLRLPVTAIGAHDSLLELGMDSMRMLAWLNRLRARGHSVRLRDLYGRPTLAGWRALLSDPPARAGPRLPETHSLPTMHDLAPFALTPVQHAYLVGRDPSQPLGGVGCHLYQEFDGDGLAPAVLEAAIRTLLARHPMLGVRFLREGLQCRLPQPAWRDLTVHDLRDADANTITQRLCALRDALGHRVLAVERGQTLDFQLTLLPGGRHRLHVNLDLLVADAASFTQLFTELATLVAGQTLPPLADGYDFRSYLHHADVVHAESRARAREWWLARLPALPPAPALPLAADGAALRPGAPVRMTRRHVALDAVDWQRFRTHAAARGVTPTMALATLFAAVLARWSSATRALVNLTLFDREPLHPAVDAMVADFTNILLLDLDGGTAPFDQMARANQAAFAEAWEHRHWSGVEVQRELRKAGRHPHGAPIVFTSNLGHPLFGHDPDRLLGEPAWGISQTPQVWIDHLAYEYGGQTRLQWDANDALFPPGLVDTLFGAYVGLVRQLAGDDASAWQRPLPDPMPAHQFEVRRTVNDTAAPMPTGCLHDAVFARADQEPDAIALIHGADVLRYGDLALLARRLAGTLHARGVRAGDPVAICMEKGVGQVVAALGILQAGAVYVPVAADQPRARRDAICRQARARLVLTCATATATATGTEGTDGAASDAGRAPEMLTWQAVVRGVPYTPAEPRSPADPAYIVFTSGSTGTPKGVVISHAGAANTCADLNRRYGVGPADRVLGLSALHFDLSVYDIFGVLGAGGTLVLVDERHRRDPAAWCDAIAQHRITLWNSVPALFDMLLTYAEGTGSRAPAALRLAMLSGDWIGLDLPGRFQRLRPGALLVAMGGATEASIWSNVHEVAGPLPAQWRSIPYGRPLANQMYRVVGADGRDCPDWVPGELWIGGAGVALGYLDDPARTAEKFVEADGTRWYRTGDLGCHWPDGTLEFLGRRDRQVKLGGHRVELGEIDAALLAIPGVRQAVTLATGTRDHRLVACVVADVATLGQTVAPDPAMPDDIAALFDTAAAPATAPARPADDDGAVAAFLLAHLARHGIDFATPGAADAAGIDVDACIAACGAQPAFGPVVARWLDWLCEAGQLQRDAGGRYLPAPHRPALPTRDPGATPALPADHHPWLDAILAGRQSPLALLDHPTLAPDAMQLAHAGAGPALDALASVIARLAQRLGRPLRVAEPYARSGRFAEALLARLTPGQVTYRLSDPSPAMVARQRERLAGAAHATPLAFATLTQAPEHWHHADVVLLNNVLHRLPDDAWSGTLRLASRLGAPGGWLQVLELEAMPAVGLVTAALFREGAVRPASAWRETFAAMSMPCAHANSFGGLASFALPLPGVAHRPHADGLRERLIDVLPAYMVPHRVLWLDALPLTANGKVDHAALAALAAPEPAAADGPVAGEPPSGDAECVLAALWQQSLRLATPRRDSHFFEAGGDSLLATRLIGELARRGYHAELGDLFAAPTLAGFAATLTRDTRHPGDGAGDTPSCAPDAAGLLPLTDVQQAYLAGRQPGFALGGVGAHFFVEFEIDAPDIARLQTAWNTLVVRHDMLRAVVRDGQLHVLPVVPRFDIPTHRLSSFDDGDGLVLRSRLSQQVLDPSRWPVFDLQLGRIDGHGPARLYLLLDNLMLDGLSMQILLAELEDLYADPGLTLPTIDTHYGACRRAMRAAPGEAAVRYWRDRIATLPAPPALKLAADPAQIGRPRFVRRSGRLAAPDWQRLRARAAPLRVTPSALLLTAFGTVLSAWSTRAALTLNLTLFDRPPVHPHVERVLGDFTSLLLLAWTPHDTLRDTAQHLQQRLWHDLTHRDYPAIRVMRDMARRDGAASTAMPVVFTSALGFDNGRFLHHDTWLRPVWGLSQTPQVWLDHQVYESDGDLCFNWDAVQALFAPDDLDAMFDQYCALLRRLADPDDHGAAWLLPLDALAPRAVPLAPDAPPASGPPPAAAAPADDAQAPVLLRRVQSVFQDVVGQPVDPDENFFDAGASSLQLVQIHARLVQAGHALAVTDLFAYPTPRALGIHLAGGAASATPSPDADARRRLRHAQRARRAGSDGDTP
ncbi:amino acid adenylation domain-containing protein [Cupriavidus sp. H18C2]|uniref:amino acid adenylation domain-containing protein n=1 Tax=Cupriavidus sp. H18C2 TaxID=3241602 RepID=UPI003BF8C0C9